MLRNCKYILYYYYSCYSSTNKTNNNSSSSRSSSIISINFVRNVDHNMMLTSNVLLCTAVTLGPKLVELEANMPSGKT